jgi:hypothetical protein
LDRVDKNRSAVLKGATVTYLVSFEKRARYRTWISGSSSVSSTSFDSGFLGCLISGSMSDPRIPNPTSIYSTSQFARTGCLSTLPLNASLAGNAETLSL